jgi:hypothetical protein
MEFVTVTFPRVRGVQMDGAPEGQTGDLIGVQRGHHIFDLGLPLDYTPPSRTEVVAGTSQDRPMIIAFEPAPSFDMARPRSAPRPPAAPGARKARPRGRKKAGKKKAAKKQKTARTKAGKKNTWRKKIGRKR